MCGGGCGKVIGLAASFVVPVFAPAIFGAMTASSSLLLGAAIGGVTSALSGGDFFKGALLGGAASGLGGLFRGMGGMEGMGNSLSAGTFMDDAAGAFSRGFAPVSSGVSNASGLISGDAGLSLGTPNFDAATSSLSQGPLLGLNSGETLMSAGLNVPAAYDTGTLVGGMQGAAAANAPISTGGGLLSNISGSSLLKALPALAGQFGQQGPDMGDINAALTRQTELNQQAFDINKAMVNKKAAIGDSLAVNALNMNPDYYGRQAEAAAAGQADNGWADYEAKLRAQGYDQNYINAQKQKFMVNRSTQTGTAYDRGAMSGLDKQNATYSTAGGMYSTGLSAPSSNMQDYINAKQEGSKDANAIGAAVETIFSPVAKTNKSKLDEQVV